MATPAQDGDMSAEASGTTVEVQPAQNMEPSRTKKDDELRERCEEGNNKPDIPSPKGNMEEHSDPPFGLANTEEDTVDGGIDIVTVHGLHGSRDTSWRPRDSPETDIFCDIGGEDCRVMHYGYNPLEGRHGIYSRNGISREASRLLRQLAEARQSISDDVFRDIVFVGHDIGGSIIKQAVYLAGLDPTYSDIASCTKLLMPPHSAHMEDMMTRLAFSGSKSPQTNALRRIAMLTSAVLESTRSFVESKAQLRAKVVVVSSTNTDPAQTVFDVHTVTTNFFLETRLTTHEPHASLPCASKDSDIWTSLSSAIADVKARFVSGAYYDPALKHAYWDLLVSISPAFKPLTRPSFDTDSMKWLTSHHKFEKWRSNSQSDILVIEGTEVAKSPRISEYICWTLGETSTKQDQYAYFSFSARNNRQNNMLDFLASVLSQWLGNQIIDRDFDWLWEVSRFVHQSACTEKDLLYLLVKLRDFDVYGATIFVLNNVEQCSALNPLFWNQIEYLFATRDIPWKFVLLTESLQGLANDWLAAWPSISIDGETGMSLLLDQNLAAKLDFELEELFESDCETNTSVEEVRKVLLKRSANDLRQGWFMLRQLQHNKASEMRKRLSEIEETPLPALAERILDSVPEPARSFITKVLSFVLFARRPLTTTELYSAMNVGENCSRGINLLAHSSSQAAVGRFTKKVEDLLPGIFDLDYEVDFLHPQLRELFLMAKDVWYDVKDSANEVILRVCLDFLGSEDGKRSLDRFQTTRHGFLSTVVFKPRDDLGAYAAEYWSQHYHPASDSTGAVGSVRQFFQQEATLRTWEQAHWFMLNPLTRTNKSYASTVPLAASLGLKSAVELAQDEESSRYSLVEASRNGQVELVQQFIENTVIDHETAEAVLLSASSCADESLQISLITHLKASLQGLSLPRQLIIRASWLGQTSLAEVLVGHGVDLNVDDEAFEQQGPLHLAARNGHYEIAELLLRHDSSLVHTLSESKLSPIKFASTHGHPKLVKLVLDYGADKNERMDKPRPIAVACYDGKHAAARVLLDAGAEADFQDPDGYWPPLVVAAFDNHIGCVRELLDHGSQVDYLCSGGTALYQAVPNSSLAACRMLLDRGADVNYVGQKGSALAIAAANSNFEMVKLLVERGADVNKRANEEDATALRQAVASKAGIEMVTYLLDNGADVNARTPQTAPIYDACLTRDLEVVRLLIGRGAHVNIIVEGRTPLHAAYQDAMITRVLLDAGADIDKVHEGWGPSVLDLAVMMNSPETLEVLLQHSADVNLRYHESGGSSLDGFTALSFAVLHNYVDIARLLLEVGADLNIKHDDGTFILQDVKSEEMMRTLMEFCPDLTLKDEGGRTALHANLFPLSVAKILVHAGCDIDKPDKMGRTPLFNALWVDYIDTERFLIKKGANVNAWSEDHGSPLHSACSSGSLDSVKLLVEAGAGVEKDHPMLGTPLYSACARPGSFTSDLDVHDTHAREIIEYLLHESEKKASIDETQAPFRFPINAASAYCSVSTIDVLLEAGANAKVQDSFGRGPIHFAAHSSIANFERIRKEGADLSFRDKLGRTALHFAVQSGNVGIVKAVLAATDGWIGATDIHGWTPLHYAARGCHQLADPRNKSWSNEMILFLIEQGCGIGGLSPGPSSKWSPLKLARYYGADEEVQSLLAPKEKRKRNGTKWDDAEHQSRKGKIHGFVYCDCCLFSVRGLRYKCEDCDNFDFCFKCYSLVDILHPDHQITEIGPEFELEISEESENDAVEGEIDDDDDDASSGSHGDEDDID